MGEKKELKFSIYYDTFVRRASDAQPFIIIIYEMGKLLLQLLSTRHTVPQ